MGNLKEDDMADAGAWDFLKGCVKLIWAHSKLFLLILALIVFPLGALEFALTDIFTSVEINSVVLPEIQKWAANNYTIEWDPESVASTGAIAVGNALINQVISIIPVICVVYSVAAILLKKSVTFADTVGAVPRLWRPVILTSLSLFTIGIGLLFSIGLLYVAAYYLFSNMILVLVPAFVGWLLAIFLGFSFQLAAVASVLEGIYGWKALGKSWRLLQGKKSVAFWTLCVTCVITLFAWYASNWICNGIFAILGISLDPLLPSPGAASHPILAAAIQVVIRAAFTSVSIVLYMGMETFLYFSCKAVHGESVTESDFFQEDVMQGAYEQIGQHPEHSEV